MIQETCVRIDQLQDFWEAELASRYARRNKIRQIDELLEQFELLNLADEQMIPADLQRRVAEFVRAEAHPLGVRSPDEVGIADWMEALYDVQDGLMVHFPDDID